MFVSLILYGENYKETLNPAEAINMLVIISRKEFTFTNIVEHDEESMFEIGISKLCQEYTDTPITFTDSKRKN